MSMRLMLSVPLGLLGVYGLAQVVQHIRFALRMRMLEAKGMWGVGGMMEPAQQINGAEKRIRFSFVDMIGDSSINWEATAVVPLGAPYNDPADPVAVLYLVDSPLTLRTKYTDTHRWKRLVRLWGIVVLLAAVALYITWNVL